MNVHLHDVSIERDIPAQCYAGHWVLLLCEVTCDVLGEMCTWGSVNCGVNKEDFSPEEFGAISSIAP